MPPPALLPILLSLTLASCAFAPVDALEAARRQHPQLPLPATMPAASMRLPFFTRLMAQPLEAETRLAELESALRAAADTPQALFQLNTYLAGIELSRGPQQLAAIDQRLQASAAPLAEALDRLDARPHPANDPLPPAFARQLASLLQVIADAEQFRQRAFARLPASASDALLLRQVVDGHFLPFEEPDFRQLLSQVEYEALAAGMLDLLSASAALVDLLKSTPLPPLSWQADTPLGRILIDTHPRDHQHDASEMLLLIDGAGNDRYHFHPRAAQHRLRLIIDLAGDDHYLSHASASGPAAAVLGHDLLWDVAGDDHYDSPQASANQAAALFGAAVLIDEDGDDRYQARSHAQAWATAGLALLLDRNGDDRYHALSQAQAAAGPRAVATLLDVRGNDRYQLAASPLVFPSAQLPERNLSMGQGAAMGIRAEFSDGRSLPGGLAILADFAGDDHYQAEVFAQGAGYFEGSGVLIDAGGEDHFSAAWYALGAAAHRAIGLFSKRGDGDDQYTVSHSTALAAAHDLSLAYFADQGGNNRFSLGDLGFGTAHDNGVALFRAGEGLNQYQLSGRRCLAFGRNWLNTTEGPRLRLPNLGLFIAPDNPAPGVCKGEAG